MKYFSLRWVCLVSALVLVMGCASLKDRPIPPDYLKFTANALPPRTELINPVRLATLGEQTFHADSVKTWNPSGDEAAQQLLASRAAARRQALRTLATKLLATPLGEGRNLSQFLDENPAQDGALEALIDSRSVVSYPATTGNQVVAEATLKGSELVIIFNGQDRLLPLNELPPETREALKKTTYEAAIRLARDRMHIGALEIPLKNGQRLGDVLAEKPAALRELNEMIDTAEPDEIKYFDDGACELIFFFDQNMARALTQKHHGWFH